MVGTGKLVSSWSLSPAGSTHPSPQAPGPGQSALGFPLSRQNVKLLVRGAARDKGLTQGGFLSWLWPWQPVPHVPG